MKKIISLALVLTFVFAMFTSSFATSDIPGVTHSTGAWEVIEDGKGVKATSAGILLLDVTMTAGSIEFTVDMATILSGGKPAVYLQGTGFENVTGTMSNEIEAVTTDSYYIWFHQYPCLALVDMQAGKYDASYQNSANDFDMYVENPKELTEITFKFEFGNGSCQAYIAGKKCDKSMPISYSATGNQVTLYGATGTQFTDVKINGEDYLFKAPVVDDNAETGDATVIAIAVVSFATLAAGAVLTIAKKKIAK
ncbi:MAG: hypothetical protein IJZ03_09095 [Clostridia bacterium]|nr:hypothetical protein [Clostridia bacterium]MBQ8743506.1 hypothetical protein [Clostridia bacterium]